MRKIAILPLALGCFLLSSCIVSKKKYEIAEACKLVKDLHYVKFDETVDSELLDFITSKYELYNKLTEDRANTLFKNIWFNEMYDRKVRGMI